MNRVLAHQVHVGDRVMTDQSVERLEVFEVRREGDVTRVRTPLGWSAFRAHDKVHIEKRAI